MQRTFVEVISTRHWRWLLALLVGIGVFFLTFRLSSPFRFVLAYDAALILDLVVLLGMMWTRSPEQSFHHAQKDDPSSTRMTALTVVFTMGSLGALWFLARNARSTAISDHAKDLHVFLSLVAIFLSWTMVHTYYALQYAFMYYQDPPSGSDADYCRGLDFHIEGKISYRVFLYYSFTIAMCYQTSDIEIVSQEMRDTTLIHSVLSFVYVAAVLGLVISVLSNAF